MKLVNKDQVSHIIITDVTEGVECWYGTFQKYVWMDVDYFKLFWLFTTPSINYNSGFYKDRKREWITNDTPLKMKKEHLVIDGKVYTKPSIKIFCGKELIHKEYFPTFVEAKEHVELYYPNCQVIY